MSLLPLEGKTALITEGDCEVGRAIAAAFASAGANVAIAYCGEEQDAQQTVHCVTRAGRRSMAIKGDIRDIDQREYIVDAAIRNFGQLDIVVNNSAFEWLHKLRADAEVTQIEREFRTNSELVFHFAEAVAERMSAGGAIINTAPMRYAHPV
jgi:NAD(P)-dependent dehydrogenase (short-subunit alcohol dehydrogenase family)